MAGEAETKFCLRPVPAMPPSPPTVTWQHSPCAVCCCLDGRLSEASHELAQPKSPPLLHQAGLSAWAGTGFDSPLCPQCLAFGKHSK